MIKTVVLLSRNLILIIAIFSFWLFIYLSNIKEEEKKKDFKENFKDNIADDDVIRTGYHIVNPVESYTEIMV